MNRTCEVNGILGVRQNHHQPIKLLGNGFRGAEESTFFIHSIINREVVATGCGDKSLLLLDHIFPEPNLTFSFFFI